MNPAPEPETTTLSAVGAALADRGFAVVPGFLDGAAVATLREEAVALRDGGSLREASVGRGEEKRVRAGIRGDETHWLEPADPTTAQRGYWAAMESLRATLNRELYLGLFDLEAHLARYPPGAFYKPHLDCHRGVSTRVVSAIVYLNDDWSPDDGGHLRLFTDRAAGIAGPCRDVAPESGTLVLFLSADFWHEVLPARRERFSLTGWFRRRGDTAV